MNFPYLSRFYYISDVKMEMYNLIQQNDWIDDGTRNARVPTRGR